MSPHETIAGAAPSEALALTAGSPHGCAFFPDRTAQRLRTSVGSVDGPTYRQLLDTNHRRSGLVVYRMACPSCNACRASRIPVARFRSSRTQRKCWRRNSDLETTVSEPRPGPEKLELLGRYRRAEHGKRDELSLERLHELYASPAPSLEVEYRVRGRLVAVALVDYDPDFLNGALFFSDPDQRRRSLGTYNVLFLLDYAARSGIDYLYLGYYLEGRPKLDYKARFRPLEILYPDGRWRVLEEEPA